MAQIAIALNAKTYRSITLDLTNLTAGYDRAEVQVSSRRDFQAPMSPVYDFAKATPLVVQFLNQDEVYYVRAREKVLATGARLGWSNTLVVYTPVNTARVTAPQAIMVQPAIVVVPEPVTWAPLGVLGQYPAENLSSDSPNEQCAFTFQSGSTIDFDTQGQPIDTIALLGTNAPAGATMQIRSYTSAANRTAATSVQYDSGAGIPFHASAGLPGRPWYHMLHRTPTLRSEQFWRITLGGDATPSSLGFATFGIVGRARTAKNIAADKSEAALDYGAIERLRDGTPDRRLGFRGRRVEFEIALMTEAQWETQYSDLRDAIGLTDPVLVVPNTRANAFFHDRILYGPVANNRMVQPFTPRMTQALTIESLV